MQADSAGNQVRIALLLVKSRIYSRGLVVMILDGVDINKCIFANKNFRNGIKKERS